MNFGDSKQKPNDSNNGNHISEACKFFRRLSGKNVLAYAKSIGVSHTYWNDLEGGNRMGPSIKVKQNISQVSGLSYDAVEIIFSNNKIEINDLYKFIIDSLEQHVQDQTNDTLIL